MSRRSYTDEQRAEALALYAVHGKAETARLTGIAEGTLGAWASRAGVATVAADVTRAATAVAAERRRYVAEEFRAQMVERLAEIASAASEAELRRIAGEKATLHEIVGARTRAIHDLQLLSGEATGRHETRSTDMLDREIERLLERASS